MRLNLLFAAALALLLSACGTLTGIPAHGGGKRFAVEQELVAASARAAVKNMDLSALQGRKAAIYISVMDDQGSGTISGGRYSLSALYAENTPPLPKTSAATPTPPSALPPPPHLPASPGRRMPSPSSTLPQARAAKHAASATAVRQALPSTASANTATKPSPPTRAIPPFSTT